MTNLKISQLSQAVLPLEGNEIMTLVQGGQNVQCSVGVLTSISVTPSVGNVYFHGCYATGNTGSPTNTLAAAGGYAYPSFTSIGFDTDGYIDSSGNIVIPAGLEGFYLVNFGSAFTSSSIGQLGCVAIASSVGDAFNQCVTVTNYFEISGWTETAIIANYLAGHQIVLSVINQTPSGPPLYFDCAAQVSYLGVQAPPPPPPPMMTQPFITSDTGGSNLSGVSGYTVGYKFTVGGSNLTVTQLGRWTYAGDTLISSFSQILTLFYPIRRSRTRTLH